MKQEIVFLRNVCCVYQSSSARPDRKKKKKTTIGLHESANLTHWVHEDQLWVLTLPFVTSQRANLTNTACSLEMGSKQKK